MYTKEIKACESRLVELDNVIRTLYEDKIRGTVPDGIFKSLMQNYEAERLERTRTLSEMKDKLTKKGLCCNCKKFKRAKDTTS